MANFKVNDFTTIEDFISLDEYREVLKHGQIAYYQKFIGYVNDKKVSGWRCTKDDSIYKMKEDE